MSNLYDAFKNKLSHSGKKIILTPTSGYSFKEVDAYTAKLSKLLFDFGLRPGDRLAAQLEKSEFNLFLYLACLRSGIIYLPLNTTYTEEELYYFFSDAQPKMIVCDPKKELALRKINGGVVNYLLKTIDEKGEGSLTTQINAVKNESDDIYSAKPDETAVILYTSGTTGKPKGAMITHQGLHSNALDLIKVWGVTEQDTILHMLPLFHVHGLFFALHTALLSGASVILLPKFDNDQFFKYLSRASVFMGVPTYYMRLLNDNRLHEESCRSMRLFISGSAPLLSSTFNDFQSRTGHTLLERYGMTETGINTSNPLIGERKVGTVGLPLPGVTVRVVNDNNELLTLNEVGHIQIKGNNLFNGYWQKPEKTKEDFTTDGYFKTGDLGTWDSEGYLSIVGRSKDMVISGGLNVYPKEIELTIDSLDGVSESAVIGVPHPDFGEAVIAVVTCDQTKVSEQFVLEMVKQRHAGYKCPKKIFFAGELPKNTMGKVQKNVLRDQFSNTFQ